MSVLMIWAPSRKHIMNTRAIVYYSGPYKTVLLISMSREIQIIMSNSNSIWTFSLLSQVLEYTVYSGSCGEQMIYVTHNTNGVSLAKQNKKLTFFFFNQMQFLYYGSTFSIKTKKRKQSEYQNTCMNQLWLLNHSTK